VSDEAPIFPLGRVSPPAEHWPAIAAQIALACVTHLDLLK
jgi:hypothetical protein